MHDIYEYIEDHWRDAIDDLKRFCRQPSISAQDAGMVETVALLVQIMKEYDIDAQVLTNPDNGYPFVYGEMKGESPSTLLFYNHYDVQPPEPLELWSSPPFEPTEYEGNLRARGVADNKGDIISRLLTLRAYRRQRGKLPVSIKFIIEGEEEIGSPNMAAFTEHHRQLLKAHGCIWECGGVNWRNEPVISLGLKGILYVQLEARGALQDVHSSMATIVPNPTWRLVWALASIKDMEENININGFYDNIRHQTQDETDAIEAIPSDEEEAKESLGLKGFIKGVTGYDYKSRHILEPTCNICGFDAGYTGPGSKTVLPNFASVKLDFRLVPNQNPDDVLDKLRRHLDTQGFDDITIASQVEGENPARTPLDSPFVAMVAEAAREVYATEPVIVPSMAGSGPMYSFTDTIGMPTVLIGVSYPGSRVHAPDEHIRFADFILNAKHIARIMELMSF